MFKAKKSRKGICEVQLDGELSIYEASELKMKLDEYIPKCKAITINLSAIMELDTACLQVLMMAKRECQNEKKEFTMTGHSPAVIEVLELLDLENYFGDPIVV